MTNIRFTVKMMIHKRFDVTDVPDAFLFLPEQLGGLGLRNPFVRLFLVRSKVDKTPNDIIEGFLEEESREYLTAKKAFAETNDTTLRRRLHNLYLDQDLSLSAIHPSEVNTFMSLEEYSRFRETTSSALGDTYRWLQAVPDEQTIALSKEVELALAKLGDQVERSTLDGEKKWILQLYAQELFETCGGLSLVDKQFLPVGVLSMMRGKKVTWQMVL